MSVIEDDVVRFLPAFLAGKDPTSWQQAVPEEQPWQTMAGRFARPLVPVTIDLHRAPPTGGNYQTSAGVCDTPDYVPPD